MNAVCGFAHVISNALSLVPSKGLRWLKGRGMVKENPEENKEIYSTDSFSVKKKIYCIQIGL